MRSVFVCSEFLTDPDPTYTEVLTATAAADVQETSFAHKLKARVRTVTWDMAEDGRDSS